MEKETKAVMDNYETVLAKHMEEESSKRGEQRRIQREIEACTAKGGTYADGNCTVMIRDWDKMPALNQGDYSGCIPNAGCAITAATMDPDPHKKPKITDKIRSQMSKRGWTDKSVGETLNNPKHVSEAINKANGNPAKAYLRV